MKIATKTIARYAVFMGSAAVCGMAQAHTGHGTSSLMEGFAHPFGTDHLLAMVAVGLWSLVALPSGKTWQGPATFMGALVLSALVGATGVSVPFLEHSIALSVVLFGLMVALSRQQIPTSVGLSLVAVAASLHGLAHGAESPTSDFGGYALGFLCTTAALHVAGVAAGLGIRRLLARQATWALGAAGTALGGAGLYLFAQV